jgi:hypothetical protein
MSKLDKNIPKRFRLEYIFIYWQEEFERIAGRLVEVTGGKEDVGIGVGAVAGYTYSEHSFTDQE